MGITATTNRFEPETSRLRVPGLIIHWATDKKKMTWNFHRWFSIQKQVNWCTIDPPQKSFKVIFPIRSFRQKVVYIGNRLNISSNKDREMYHWQPLLSLNDVGSVAGCTTDKDYYSFYYLIAIILVVLHWWRSFYTQKRNCWCFLYE